MAGRVRWLLGITLVGTTVLLYPQSPPEWSGVQALVLRLRDVGVVITAAPGRTVNLSGQSPARQWETRVEQNQLIVEAYPLPGPAEPVPPLEVSLAPEVELHVFTTLGDITISGSRRVRVLRSLRGTIRLKDTAGQLKADTLTGAILIENHTGDFQLQTSSGEMILRGMRPQRLSQALSASGDIFLQLLNRDQVSLTATSLNPHLVVFGEQRVDRFRGGSGPVSVTVASSEGRVEVTGP